MRVRTLFRVGVIAGRSVLDLASPHEREVTDEIAKVDALRKDGNVVGVIHMLGSDVRGRSKNSIVRDHAAVALGRMGDPRAIPYLMEMRDDPEEMVRFSVIQALGRLKAKEAQGFLLERLNDPSELLRTSAASALGHIGAVDAIPTLREILDSDPDRVMRLVAVESLIILGDESARDRVRRS
jgi:HEAT repeat protein